MKLTELREMCAEICDSQADNARTSQGEIRAANCAERIRAIVLPPEQDHPEWSSIKTYVDKIAEMEKQVSDLKESLRYTLSRTYLAIKDEQEMILARERAK